MGAIIVIAVTSLAFLGLLITMAVTSSGSRTRPDRPEKQPTAVADEDNRGLLDNLAGRDPVTDASSYPRLGALMGPLLTPPPLRDTSAHESHARTVIQVVDRFNDQLASVHDVASGHAAGVQMQALSDKAKADSAAYHAPFRMTAAEEALMNQRLAPEIRRVMDRYRTESRRIAGIPGLRRAGMQLVTQANVHFNLLELRLKMAENFKPRSGALPYAEVYVKAADEDAEAVCRQQLWSLLGDEVGMQSGYSSDRKKASFRVWPVDDPEMFSRRIEFGKVTAVKGRNIFVTANSFTDAEVASAREELKKREIPELARQALAARPEANDPKPPADADDLTRLLFDLRSSNFSKRTEAVKKLGRFAKTPDRNEEVSQQLIALLQDRDVFLVKEVMLAMVHWQTDETVSVLIKQLDTSNPFIRDEAAKILGNLGDARAAEPMINLLKTNPFVVDALRRMGAAAEPALINALTDPDPDIRRGVCDVLEQTGGKDALVKMMQLPADTDPLVRIKASIAMKEIQKRVGSVSLPRKPAAKPGRNP
jgi:HEAT repeats/PBS lyase HEAT-like repeat